MTILAVTIAGLVDMDVNTWHDTYGAHW